MAGVTTSYKNPIGSHLAYPMSLAIINDGISPVGEILNIQVRFFSYKPPKPGETRKRYEICEVRYDPSCKDVRDMYVSPVPREIQKYIHDRIGPLLSDTIAPWLSKKQMTGWDQRYHALTIWFNTTTDSFEINERNGA